MMSLADEPTGNLDPDMALEVMNLFREINASGTTVVVATHDRDLIRQVGHRALMLEHGVITEEASAYGESVYYRAPPEELAQVDESAWNEVAAEETRAKPGASFDDVDAALATESDVMADDERRDEVG